jgi:holin-like protein
LTCISGSCRDRLIRFFCLHLMLFCCRQAGDSRGLLPNEEEPTHDSSNAAEGASPMILQGLTWLVLLQLLGNLINLVLLPALPGPIIGMLLLFGLLLRQHQAAGIMTSAGALLDDLPAIAAGLVLSLLITVPFCGWLMQRLIRRLDRQREDQA